MNQIQWHYLFRVEVSSIAGAQLANSSDLITNKREIQSTVLADDKEIIVLGGLINEEVEESSKSCTYSWRYTTIRSAIQIFSRIC